MQVLKLVYIAHGWMLGLAGKPLIADEIEAWKYGPVIPELYHALKSYRSDTVTQVPGAENAVFDADEQSIMDQVCRIYGDQDGIQLSQLTHQNGSPWAQTWNSRIRGNVISNDVIRAHYAALGQSQR
ncbi:type II toxin-antitoxin system antitoxin SocA domain-containing protein [Luteimonas sp. FCS-9]|uniref:Panacea domain-containing protein n=1 Tax=Luteimonas sp. FCS-9 TaxID=1547516 RepID=UPI000AC25EC4|nr:type II toxin-antitoxin system antitoxin SocA domain-containing protein [Luteimonas sp. FCS-9]